MTDTPLASAQIIWDIADDEKRAGDPPIRVMKRGDKDDDRYTASWGACNSDFNEATAKKRLLMLFQQFVHLTVNEGIEPQAVHDAFLSIPEYRRGLADIGALDPALVGDEDDDG